MGNGSLIEEQTLPFYHQQRYYPVRIGDTLKDRYSIIAKLGYGGYSTAWLARDERTKQYASLEVCIEQDNDQPSPVLNEINMLRRMEKRAEADIVSECKGAENLSEVFECTRLFFAINWLQAVCHLIHTGQIKFQAGILTKKRKIPPSIPIISDTGVTVYPSRTPFLELGGIPMLTDFGEMREGDSDGRVNDEWIMPDLYRAPEVLLQIPWTFQVEMWSVGGMTLELLEGRNLFDPMDHVNEQYASDGRRCTCSKRALSFETYFDKNVPQTSLEDFVRTIPPGEEKDLFHRFIRKMLAWNPEARATANEIINAGMASQAV
ncbi:kinase-like protein [Aspergillus homomorphus CBS 101889]|uniref:Kinase-like protein n=1 Tax=Aspergillus homomorphus (strain CBS 101889) TaxID=1450537 RepID=A0A395I566_ASPHC|nr:kinase-like protein [Aspergillus homomorphus CBS 101889]RAL14906.1 kinase-like protein [Aspergillus homomorphus CBS 101889]